MSILGSHGSTTINMSASVIQIRILESNRKSMALKPIQILLYRRESKSSMVSSSVYTVGGLEREGEKDV